MRPSSGVVSQRVRIRGGGDGSLLGARLRWSLSSRFHPKLASRPYARAEQLFQVGIELLQKRPLTGIPVLEVAALARLIEILARIPQLVHVFTLDDLHDLQADVPQGFDL